jgi:hypothetical protein
VARTQHCINDAAATPRRFVLARYAAARISSDTTRMSQDHPAWVAHQRARWLRPDAHLFVRPDAHRFMPPGAPRLLGKDAVRYFWPAPTSERRAQAPDYTHDAQLAVARASLARLKRDVAALAFALKFNRLLREKGYNPDQPRVPADNPDGGQWTDGGSPSNSPPQPVLKMPGRKPPSAKERNAVVEGLQPGSQRRDSPSPISWRGVPGSTRRTLTSTPTSTSRDRWVNCTSWFRAPERAMMFIISSSRHRQTRMGFRDG